MELKNQLIVALRTGGDDARILALIRGADPRFQDQQEVYNLLQNIWTELGFDERSDGGMMQDTLEFLMEKTWYECPLGKSVK